VQTKGKFLLYKSFPVYSQQSLGRYVLLVGFITKAWYHFIDWLTSWPCDHCSTRDHVTWSLCLLKPAVATTQKRNPRVGGLYILQILETKLRASWKVLAAVVSTQLLKLLRKSLTQIINQRRFRLLPMLVAWHNL